MLRTQVKNLLWTPFLKGFSTLKPPFQTWIIRCPLQSIQCESRNNQLGGNFSVSCRLGEKGRRFRSVSNLHHILLRNLGSSLYVWPKHFLNVFNHISKKFVVYLVIKGPIFKFCLDFYKFDIHWTGNEKFIWFLRKFTKF